MTRLTKILILPGLTLILLAIVILFVNGVDFSSGKIQSSDIYIKLETHEKDKQAISFETTKIRGGKEMQFTSPIDWDTLRISPQSIDRPQAKEPIKKAGKKQQQEPAQEPAQDLPWNT